MEEGPEICFKSQSTPLPLEGLKYASNPKGGITPRGPEICFNFRRVTYRRSSRNTPQAVRYSYREGEMYSYRRHASSTTPKQTDNPHYSLVTRGPRGSTINMENTYEKQYVMD